jgi:hypothetical protein
VCPVSHIISINSRPGLEKFAVSRFPFPCKRLTDPLIWLEYFVAQKSGLEIDLFSPFWKLEHDLTILTKNLSF